MSLTNDDLGKLGQLLDKRDDTLVEKITEVEERLLGEMNKRDEKLVEKMSKLMDERLLYFHEKVTAPMVDNVVEVLREEIAKVSDNTDRIERKLDNIADHHSDKIDDHEKRIVRLETRTVVSL